MNEKTLEKYKNIKYILFDMDGVLVNTEPLSYAIWKQAFHDYGIEIDYEHYKPCVGSTMDFLFGLVEDMIGHELEEKSKYRERYSQIKREYIERGEGFPKVKDVPDVIRYLKKKGYKLAVASSSKQEFIEKAMEELGITDCFELLFSGERVENPKPSPDIFLEVAARLGADPSECAVVEDSTNGSRAAKAAGMVCFGFDNPDSENQDLSIDDEIFYPFINLKKYL